MSGTWWAVSHVEHLAVTLPCVTQRFGNDPCKPEVRHRTMDHPCRSDSLRGPHSALHTSCCHYYLLKQASLMNKVFFVGMEPVLLVLTASRCTTILMWRQVFRRTCKSRPYPDVARITSRNSSSGIKSQSSKECLEYTRPLLSQVA
jgi:hypothetical protein